jgi:tRNA (cmo5U34)-methyltransferase
VTVLDLGAGTGLLAEAVRASVPSCDLVLMDHSEEMLAKAQERFEPDARVSYLVSEFASLDGNHAFDAVVSALAIHHLEDSDKQALFVRVKNALRPGGVFVNVEQVCAPREDTEELYDEMHVAHVQRAGTTTKEWAAARDRMMFDKPASMYSQLRWMEDAGFQAVDCLYKNFRFATIVGWV